MILFMLGRLLKEIILTFLVMATFTLASSITTLMDIKGQSISEALCVGGD